MAGVEFRRILPDTAEGLSAEDLVSAIEPAEREDRPYVVLNMIASVDGRAAVDGRTKGLGHPADRALFHRLRTIADAVFVGAGTIRAEGYRELIRDDELYAAREARGLDREPLLAVPTASGDLGGERGPLSRPENHVVVLGGGRVEEAAATVSHVPAGTASGWFEALRRDFGVRLLLSEGGPAINAGLLAAGLVDELQLCVASMLVGGDDPLTIVDGPALAPPARLGLASIHESDGYLFLRYTLR